MLAGCRPRCRPAAPRHLSLSSRAKPLSTGRKLLSIAPADENFAGPLEAATVLDVTIFPRDNHARSWRRGAEDGCTL